MQVIEQTLVVDYDPDPFKVLKTFHCDLIAEGSAVARMPRGNTEKKEVKISLFCPDEVVVPEDVVAAYKDLNLIPDPYALVALNKDDPRLFRSHPNVCLWMGGRKAGSVRCHPRSDGLRRMEVGWHDIVIFQSGYWFVGVESVL